MSVVRKATKIPVRDTGHFYLNFPENVNWWFLKNMVLFDMGPFIDEIFTVIPKRKHENT